MEVTSSTTAGTSSFGQEFNDNHNSNEEETQNQHQQEPVSSDTVVVESGDQPYEIVQYGPVICPDFYEDAPLSSYAKDIPDSRAVHGSCGLHNLGNTCFMNSGIQSLMSCSPLIKYFSENFTLDESTHKTLTGHFYLLLCKMWSGQFSVVHPKKFKEFLGLYHSQFEDYRQHDCQEFLAFLLDTLHEQLNEAILSNNYLQLSSSSSPSLVCVDAATSPTVSGVPVGAATNSKLSAPSPATVSCSETELSKKRDHFHCLLADNCNNRKTAVCHKKCLEVGLGRSLVDSSNLRINDGRKLLSDSCCSVDSNDVDILASGEQHQSCAATSPSLNADSGEVSSIFKQGDDNDDDSELITSSGSSVGGSSPLKRFTSRSNLDDVSSSDIGYVVKPSLKRVSADTAVSASGLTFSSEDSNQSSLSVHSTDSDQSGTFKRLKIESWNVDLSSSSSTSLSRSNSNCNSNNNGIASGLKDFAVTSSSDYKSESRKNRIGSSVVSGVAIGGGEELVSRIKKSSDSNVSSNLLTLPDNVDEEMIQESTSGLLERSPRMAVSQPDCEDDPMEATPLTSDIAEATVKGRLQRLHSLEEFYKKESKTLNTNVLISDDSDMQEISCDSEKFAKVDNRHRLNSREINLLQEVADEEDNNSKVDKILLGQHLSIKDTNLHTQAVVAHVSPLVDNIKSGNKPLSSSQNNAIVLNNSYEEDNTLSCQEALSLSSKLQCSSHDSKGMITMMSSSSPPFKMANDVAIDFSKLDEAEKNVQMQAYTKFNTTPPKSNIRIDLTDNQTVSNTDNGDEIDNESSDDDEMEKHGPSPPSHPLVASSMESECSSIPNCLRTCLPSEVSMANEAWQRYKSANNSIVVSTFQGQFRSTVVCSQCSHVSVTYEPFMYLSLPIPHAMEQQMCVTFISYGKSPVRLLLNMMKTDKIGTCKKKLKEMMGLAGDVIMAEVLDSHVSRLLDDNVLLKYVNFFNRKIYAFEFVSNQIGCSSDPHRERSSSSHSSDRILLNNEDHGQELIIQEDLCLVSTSRADDDSGSGLILPYRTESQMSVQSLDSIHVNTPSSRDTMDLGFSDSEICDDAASLSSPNHQQQQLGFSPSYFRAEGGAAFGLSGNGDNNGDDDGDVCQSTTSEIKICCDDDNNPWMNKELTTETLSANAHCLSWQIVQEKDCDDCDETASTVTTVVGSSSSISGDDIVAPCSSSSPSTTKFWVDHPQSHNLNRDDSVLSRIKNSTIDDDDYDADDLEGDRRVGSNTREQGKNHGDDNCDSKFRDNYGDSFHSVKDCNRTMSAKGNKTFSSTKSSSTGTITSTCGEDIGGSEGRCSRCPNDFDKMDDDNRDSGNPERRCQSYGVGFDVDNNNILITTDTTSDDDNAAVGIVGTASTSINGSKHSGLTPSGSCPSQGKNYPVGDADGELDLMGKSALSNQHHDHRHHYHHHDNHRHRVITSSSSSSPSSSSSLLTGHSKGEEEERPGSYFMQSPHLHGLDSVCHTDSYGGAGEQPMTEEDAEAKCLTDDLTTFDLGQPETFDSLPLAPALSPPHCPGVTDDKAAEKSTTAASLCDDWRSCAICLEDLPVSQLLTHINCDGVFCQGCLDMSVKHTADVSFFCCPICLQPANVCEDFVSLPTSDTAKLQARMLTMCLAFRHLVIDNTGSSSLQLVGHPSVIELASVITGGDLYNVVDRLIGARGRSLPQLTYSVMLTDGQGLNCSRCPYSSHCTGCQIAREGEVILRPSDNLTVHSCQMLSPEEVSDMQFAHDDPSMATLRSSEPTTIMDCFGAFTQSEILDEHNPWYCPKCERNQCAKKTMTVWRYPDNLIIHLKRFVYQDLSSTKVDTKVVFPHRDMDVRGFLSGPSTPGLIYDLYSVICHFGGASAGHYTSYALHPLTSQWYYYNDETVSLQSPQDSEYSSGYVLFYQRQGTSVEFTPPQYLPDMEDIPAQVSTMTTSTSTFQQQQAGTTSTTTTTATSCNSSCISNNNRVTNNTSNNKMALVLFVPPTSTTPSLSDEIFAKNTISSDKNYDKSSTVHLYDDNNHDNNDDDDDDDDYDCDERRCSPSSDYGSLSVHFGSGFPNPDANSNSNMDDEIDSHFTSDGGVGVAQATLQAASLSSGTDAFLGSGTTDQEPDSTDDIFSHDDEF